MLNQIPTNGNARKLRSIFTLGDETDASAMIVS
jgi:hypothetical protein